MKLQPSNISFAPIALLALCQLTSANDFEFEDTSETAERQLVTRYPNVPACPQLSDYGTCLPKEYSRKGHFKPHICGGNHPDLCSDDGLCYVLCDKGYKGHGSTCENGQTKYSRGEGVKPTWCSSGYEHFDFTGGCIEKCVVGYLPAHYNCHKPCPDGMKFKEGEWYDFCYKLTASSERGSTPFLGDFLSQKANSKSKEVSQKANSKSKEVSQKANSKSKEVSQKANSKSKEVSQKANSKSKEVSQQANSKSNPDDLPPKCPELSGYGECRPKEYSRNAQVQDHVCGGDHPDLCSGDGLCYVPCKKGYKGHGSTCENGQTKYSRGDGVKPTWCNSGYEQYAFTDRCIAKCVNGFIPADVTCHEPCPEGTTYHVDVWFNVCRT